MRKTIVGTVLALLATTATASNWVSIGDSSKHEIFVDMQSMRSEPNGIVRAWLKTEFKQPRRLANGALANSKVVKWDLNCRSYRYDTPAGAFYDSEGKSIGSWSKTGKPQEIIPDSVGDSIATTLCTAVKR